MNVIVLFGKPGAGKGTRLSEFLKGREDDFEVLSVSSLLRKEKAEQTEIGKRAASYMEAGQLVPDDIINEIVIKGLKAAKKPIFTDGFPRTVAQTEAMLKAGINPAMVIEFYVDDNVVVERSKTRIACKKCGETYTTNSFKPPMVEGICDKCGGTIEKRKDDAEDVVLNRLKVYREETYPCLDVLAKSNVPIHTIENCNPESASKQFANLITSL